MIRIAWAALLAALVGCSAKRAETDYYGAASGYANDGYYGGESYDYDAPAMAESASMSRGGGGGGRARPSKMASAPGGPPPPAPPPPMPMEEAWGDDAGPAPEPSTPDPAPVRMVHYDGHARIRVTKPADLLATVEEKAVAAGGRVDQLYGNVITIRVPVAGFDALWDELLALGDVLDRSVRADDITDQFLAVDLRVKTLRATRDRLVELLAKATKEEEKLILLQQITRVTEQLDQFESQLSVLGDLAAMSRITIEAIPREAFTGTRRPELAGLEWVAQISPFRRAVFADDKRIALAEQEGLVTLSNKGPWVAESADGTVIWTMRMANDPVGDGSFWGDTLIDRLAEPFAKADKRQVGTWTCVDFDEAGADAPYRWEVCALPAGRHLWVAQTFFPSPTHVERYGAKVEAALNSVGGGS